MKTIFTTLLLILSMTVCAQEISVNTKFGKPTDEELNLTSYTQETNAPAVILCRMTDIGYDMFNGNIKIVTNEKVKIKILTDEGKEYVDIKVPYRKTDIIGNVKATTYNMEGGKLVKTKMPNELLFREQVDNDFMMLKFSIPQVKAGSVVEYQYRIESEYYGSIATWYAQTDIPVLYAQYDVSIPEWFKFKSEESGTHSFEKKVSSTSMTFHTKGTEVNVSGMEYHFVGRNLPSLKDDDFVWSVHDYCNKVTFELGGIFIPGSTYKNFTQTWQGIDQTLWDNEDFGGRLLQSNPFKEEMAQAGIAAISGKKVKARAILQLLLQKVKWNGKYALWGKDAKTIVKEGSGNNADLNFILIAMMKDAGLQATPVVMSTRTNGRIPLTHPSLRFMNTFIVGVADDNDEMFFLDASANYGDINILPSNLLVEKARVLRKGTGSTWTDIQRIAEGKTETQISATLNADGLLTGKATSIYTGQNVFTKRRAYKAADDSATYVKKYADNNDIDITDYQLEGAEGLSDKATQTITFTHQNNATSDMIYLNPILFSPFKENPLKTDKRELPIEFSYRDITTTTIRIQLPDNYEIESLPAATHAADSEGKLIYDLALRQEGKTLVVDQTFNVKQMFFQPTAYQDIKKTFDTIAEKSQTMIVLKKK